MPKIKKTFAVIASIVTMFAYSFTYVYAEEIATDDDRTALNEELLLNIPEETDNPNHTLSFSNPSETEGVFISIDGGKEKEITNPYSLPALGIGDHTLSFTFTNAEESESNYEVGIIVKPRPPEILPPEKNDEGVLISGEATAASTVYLFISGEKSNYREIVEVENTGKWEYLFLEDYDSSYYTAVAYATKNGYGSEMSEPIIFTIELENSGPIEENPKAEKSQIVFDYEALLTKEFWINYKEHAEFLIFSITAVSVGLLIGFLITRLMFGSKEKSLEKNLESALKGGSSKDKTKKEATLDRKARKEAKRLEKLKAKEEKRLKREAKKNKDGDNNVEKKEPAKEEGNTLLDKFKRSKQKDEEIMPQKDDDGITEEEKAGSTMVPILDQETENYNNEMSETVQPESDEVIAEEEIGKTSVSTVQKKEKPEVTAMHVPIDEDHDENFPVFEKEEDVDSEDTTGSEATTEDATDGSDEPGEDQPETKDGEETPAQETSEENPSERSEISEEEVTEPEKETKSPAEKQKVIDKSDFLAKFKVHDPDPEGEDPLDLESEGNQEEKIDEEESDEIPSDTEKSVEDNDPTNENQATEEDGTPIQATPPGSEEAEKKSMAEKLFRSTKKIAEESEAKAPEEKPEEVVEKEEAKIPLEESTIATRTLNILKGEGFTYVEELKDKSKEELLEISGIGEASIKEIKSAKKAPSSKDKKAASKKKTSKSKKGSKKSRKSKKASSRSKKNNIPPQLSGGLEDVGW